jgi:hypothetical protein
MRKRLSGLSLAMALALGGCGSGQPTIEASNRATEAELGNIAASTNETDGMDQGNATLMGTPTTGQQLDAQAQPPKRQ